MTLLARDKFFDSLWDGFYSPYTRTYRQRPNVATAKTNDGALSPKVDIVKRGDNYQLIAELPGVSKNQVSVTLDDTTLTIESKPTQQQESTDTTELIRRERHHGIYRRSFDLGQDIELSDIKASFKDGLLVLDIPKQKEQEPASRRIDIQ